MDNTKVAVEILKQALKQSGYTYADVARHLQMSEASIKKMFSTSHFTLKRIDRICELIGLDFIDLVRLFDEARQRISTLTLEQEKELVRDKRLFLVAVCVRGHWSFDEILNTFDFSKADLYGYLRRLEGLRLLELHPNNRIRLKVAENFRWIANGPIETYFYRHLLKEFLDSDFDGEKELRLYLHGPLTTVAKEALMRRLNVLAHEFSELLKDSAASPIAERHNIGLFLATREWEPAIFSGQRRMS